MDIQHLSQVLNSIEDFLYATGEFKARDPREPGRKLKQRSELRLAAVISRHFRRQKAAIKRMLELSAPARKAYGVLVDEVLDAMADDEWAEPMRRVLTEAAQNGVGIFGESTTIGLDYSLTNMEAAKWARKYAGELIKNVDATTVKAVREAVGQFVESEGMTIGDVMNLLPFGEDRAMMVAVTEITRSYAEGVMEAGQQMKREFPDVKVAKQWFTNNDDRVCEICGPLDGQEVDIDEPFSSGDDIPPAHANCRCWMSTRTRIVGD